MARTKSSCRVAADALTAMLRQLAAQACRLRRTACTVRGDEARQAIDLREVMRGGTSTRVQIELKAQGLYRPGLPPAAGLTAPRCPSRASSTCRPG